MATCYRHPSRETGVSCSNCGRPICPDCMAPTSVGMRCPECAKQKTQVRTARNLVGGEPRVTYALIAVSVAARMLRRNVIHIYRCGVRRDLAGRDHGIGERKNDANEAEDGQWDIEGPNGALLHLDERGR